MTNNKKVRVGRENAARGVRDPVTGCFISTKYQALIEDFIHTHDKTLERLMAELKPKNVRDELIINELANLAGTLKVLARDMRLHRGIKRDGSMRPSWEAYPRTLALFKDLLDRLEKAPKLLPLDEYLAKREKE